MLKMENKEKKRKILNESKSPPDFTNKYGSLGTEKYAENSDSSQSSRAGKSKFSKTKKLDKDDPLVKIDEKVQIVKNQYQIFDEQNPQTTKSSADLSAEEIAKNGKQKNLLKKVSPNKNKTFVAGSIKFKGFVPQNQINFSLLCGTIYDSDNDICLSIKNYLTNNLNQNTVATQIKIVLKFLKCSTFFSF